MTLMPSRELPHALTLVVCQTMLFPLYGPPHHPANTPMSERSFNQCQLWPLKVFSSKSAARYMVVSNGVHNVPYGHKLHGLL